MKAIVYTKYGSPAILHLADVAKPVPADNEVLIKVHAAALNAYDLHLLTADPFVIRLAGFGFLKPKRSILGADLAGRVEALGSSVKQFQVGDEVFGCYLGGFAEYAAVPERTLALKPANSSFEQAAAVPMAALTALQGLRDKGGVQPDQKVLINGASGGVGTFAVQIAKLFGAEVTAVCSPRNLDQARSLGADHVVDYTQEDFTKNGQRYDLIIAANGYHSIFDYKRALTPRGIYIMLGGSMAQMAQTMLLGPSLSSSAHQKMSSMLAQINQKDLVFLKGLIEAGKIVPVIDRCYPLDQVPDAFCYLGAGHARGKVVITV